MTMRSGILAATVALVLAPYAQAQTPEMPALVAAYMRQLAEQCGPLPPGAPTPDIVDRVDLNGDKLDDWVVDAGRYPCAERPALSAAAGSQVTVFKGVLGGVAVPAYQASAFGSRLQRTPEGERVLWVTLGGTDCGESGPEARCERRILWRGERFEAVGAGGDGPALRGGTLGVPVILRR